MYQALDITEIVLEILSYFLECGTDVEYYIRVMDIMRVCHRWRNIISINPYIWRYLILDGKKMRERTTLLYANKSAPYPLELIIIDRSVKKKYLDFVDYISKHYRFRIGHIKILNWNGNLSLYDYSDIISKRTYKILRKVSYFISYDDDTRLPYSYLCSFECDPGSSLINCQKEVNKMETGSHYYYHFVQNIVSSLETGLIDGGNITKIHVKDLYTYDIIRICSYLVNIRVLVMDDCKDGQDHMLSPILDSVPILGRLRVLKVENLSIRSTIARGYLFYNLIAPRLEVICLKIIDLSGGIVDYIQGYNLPSLKVLTVKCDMSGNTCSLIGRMVHNIIQLPTLLENLVFECTNGYRTRTQCHCHFAIESLKLYFPHIISRTCNTIS